MNLLKQLSAKILKPTSENQIERDRKQVSGLGVAKIRHNNRTFTQLPELAAYADQNELSHHDFSETSSKLQSIEENHLGRKRDLQATKNTEVHMNFKLSRHQSQQSKLPSQKYVALESETKSTRN